MKGTLVKFPHSPILHYAFSSRLEKTIKKNNIIPLGELICFDNSMGLYGNFTGTCAETLPVPFPSTAL